MPAFRTSAILDWSSGGVPHLLDIEVFQTPRGATPRTPHAIDYSVAATPKWRQGRTPKSWGRTPKRPPVGHSPRVPLTMPALTPRGECKASLATPLGGADRGRGRPHLSPASLYSPRAPPPPPPQPGMPAAPGASPGSDLRTLNLLTMCDSSSSLTSLDEFPLSKRSAEMIRRLEPHVPSAPRRTLKNRLRRRAAEKQDALDPVLPAAPATSSTPHAAAPQPGHAFVAGFAAAARGAVQSLLGRPGPGPDDSRGGAAEGRSAASKMVSFPRSGLLADPSRLAGGRRRRLRLSSKDGDEGSSGGGEPATPSAEGRVGEEKARGSRSSHSLPPPDVEDGSDQQVRRQRSRRSTARGHAVMARLLTGLPPDVQDTIHEGGGEERGGSKGSAEAVAAPPAEGRPGFKRGALSKVMSSVQDRMKRIEDKTAEMEVRKARRRKQEQHHALMLKEFNSLPKAESDDLTTVFHKFDVDDSGKLDLEEMIMCLQELGLRGTNTAEKREIMRICKRVSQACDPERDGETLEEEEAEGEALQARRVLRTWIPRSLQAEMHDDAITYAPVNLLHFALKVVPQVRARIGDLQNNDLLRVFFQFDRRGTGKIEKQACFEIARGAGLNLSILASTWEEVYGAEDGQVNVEQFTNILVRCREHGERELRKAELHIKEATGINEGTFEAFRKDILGLYQLFQRYDKDESGVLSRAELQHIFVEFGLMPRSTQGRDEVLKIIEDVDVDGNGEFDFGEFLILTNKVRVHHQQRKRDEELVCFRKYDKDQSGSLSIEEISRLLGDLGCAPSSKKEQEELGSVIQAIDEDGSGEISFEEFQVLNQRINERINFMRYEEDIDYALRLDFTEEQLRDLRWIFDTLDQDGSNTLDKGEVRCALAMMKKSVSMELYHSTFEALDADGSGCLEFKEFLDFMKLLRDGEGMFSEERQPFARYLKFLEASILRRVLGYLGLSKAYVGGLPKPECVELMCNFMGCEPDDDVTELLGINNLGELFDWAKKNAISERC